MFRPARMVHLNVLVLDRDVDRATTEMIRSGLVHLVSVSDLEPWAEQKGMQPVEDDDSRALAQVDGLARSLAEKLRIGPEEVSELLALQPFDPSEASKKLEEISRQVNAVVAARDEAARRLAGLRESMSQASRDFRDKLGVSVPSQYTLLEVAVGRLPEKSVELLKRSLWDVPNVVLTFPEEKGKTAVMVIVLKKDRDALRKATEEAGLERMPLAEKKAPASEEILEELHERLEIARQELETTQQAVEKCKAEHLPTLRAILSQVIFQKLSRMAKSRFRKTARTYLISGWTPLRSKEKVIESLKRACGNRCLVEEKTAEELLSERREGVDVPILFENPKVLEPFEMLVSNYGPPAYNSTDPTVIVAPTFLLMYGAMFGDVGQGAAMALLGALVSNWKRVSGGVKRIGKLFTWCGLSGILFGFIYGSVFGFNPYRLLRFKRYGGFEPLGNINAFLMVALFFGMAMITVGLVFNAVSALRRREWATGLFDWRGLMGLAFYWLAVAAVAQFFGGEGASRTVLGLLVAVPLAATVLRGPVEKLLSPKGRPGEPGVLARTVKSIGEMFGASFETILMFFTNTMSFLRLAAFAMAHAALFTAVFSLADVVRGGGPLPRTLAPMFVHLLGNAAMIALEGLVVCVQALRLEYYEFFGKFFQVGATEFTPMRLPRTVL